MVWCHLHGVYASLSNGCTPPYQRVYASLSTSVRLPMNECTPPYQRVYASLSASVRLPINECTPPYQRVYASLSNGVVPPARSRAPPVGEGWKRAHLGRAVQVDPIKPTLKAPRTNRLKLNPDELLTKFVFKFNLRCHTSDSIKTALNFAYEEYEGDLNELRAGAYARPLFDSTVALSVG
jgi:hypothetical protein